jgi:hypothetical protein
MEIVHRILSIFGSTVTLLGTASAACGTYFLAKRYYSTAEGFWSHLLDYPYLAMLLLSKNVDTNDMKPSDKQKLDVLELRAAAAVNPERPSDSLVGFQLVFLGFFLQLWGGVLLVLDVLLPR